MLILALETSSPAGSVALLDDDTVLSQRVLAADRRWAQLLAPAIADLLRQVAKEPSQVRLVAASIGPGSFTGLRVGVTTAKTFAYAVGCDCIGLDTLDVIAGQVPTAAELSQLHAVLDAQRKELYAACFRWQASGPVRLAPNRIVPEDEWLAGLAAGMVVTGPGVDRLMGRLPAGVIAVDEPLRQPQAITVGRLALAEHRRGRRDDLWKLVPAYVRASAAEEKAAATSPRTASPPRSN